MRSQSTHALPVCGIFNNTNRSPRGSCSSPLFCLGDNCPTVSPIRFLRHDSDSRPQGTHSMLFKWSHCHPSLQDRDNGQIQNSSLPQNILFQSPPSSSLIYFCPFWGKELHKTGLQLVNSKICILDQQLTLEFYIYLILVPQSNFQFKILLRIHTYNLTSSYTHTQSQGLWHYIRHGFESF